MPRWLSLSKPPFDKLRERAVILTKEFAMHGGDWVAEFLKAQGVSFVFTLTGGHIAPILVGCKQRGIRVIDTRHEATAVFAADAVARLTGIPGVAVVTAGPGVTNTITAVKNAQMAQSPVVLLGGAAATALKGRGALQDIDQIALLRSVVKWSRAVRRVREIVPTLEQAFEQARQGAPGPVFVELPVDLLYPEQTVREMYGMKGGGRGLAERAVQLYLRAHVGRLFRGANRQRLAPRVAAPSPMPAAERVAQAVAFLQQAQRPVLLLGSQTTLDTVGIGELVAAVERIGAPVYLSGMARGLLGKGHPLQMRHQRRQALKEADCVVLAGVPADFRLDYGNHVRRSAVLIAANRSRRDLTLNRRPTVGALGDPGRFLRLLAERVAPQPGWEAWIARLRARDAERNAEIAQQALLPTGAVNPLHCFLELEQRLGSNAILVADGGDFVATASYILNPPGPLTWLDPGPFGTLGVGAGFALGAKLARPEADVWLIYGDGSCGYSLAEFDTLARHRVAVTAVVGNDAAWMQIAREQGALLGDLVGTELAHTPYDQAAAALGGVGLAVEDPELLPETLDEALKQTRAGRPTLINVRIGRTDFRKGSLSM